MEEIPLEFKGIAPRYGKKLPAGYAEDAENCFLFHGKLSPLAKNTQVEADTHHYNSMAYHCLAWNYQNNAFYCPWKIGVLDLLLYKDTSNYLKKKVAWIITKTDISFDAASKEIRSANGDFYVNALIEGGTFVVSGSANNDGTFTVSSTATTTGVITVDEAVVNEVAGASVTIKVCKEDYLGQTRQGAPTTVVGDYTGDYTGYFEQVASRYQNSSYINTIVEFNDEIYGGTGENGKLLKWNGEDGWIKVAGQYLTEHTIRQMVVYDDELYAAGGYTGRLLKWNGVDAWIQVAPQYGAEQIFSLIVYNDKIYGGTNGLGKLLEWNGTDAWVEVAPQLGAETMIKCLVEFDGKLYGGTNPTGQLYEWNGVNAWAQKAPQLGTEVEIRSMAVYNSKIYGSTRNGGKLYEWNGVNLWVEKADTLGDELDARFLLVVNEQLYCGMGTGARLYKWNDSDAWEEVSDTAGEETSLHCLLEFEGSIFASTYPKAELYQYVEGETTYEVQYFITLTRNIGGHIDESGPGAITDVDVVVEGVEYQNITVTKPAWTGLGADTYVTHWNLYRLSSATGTWQLVASIPWATTDYVDAIADVDLGETPPGYYTSDQGNDIIWDLPLKNLDGITMNPLSGMIFAWKGSQLIWNEPGFPDAWPDFYTMNFPAAIKNCIPHSPSLAVLTAMGPFRVDGTNPEALQQSTRCGNEPATSILGCCDSKLGVLYLSDSGIALFNMSESSMLTDEVFGEKWFKANISPTGAVMIEVDNIAYLFHSTGGLMFDARANPPIITTLSEIIYGAYRKEDDEELYVMNASGNQKFGGATAGTKAMTWVSGELKGNHPEKKHFIEVELMSESGVSVDVTLYVDGTQSSTATLAMSTDPNKKHGFLDEKDYGRAAQVKIYKAAHDTLTVPGLEIIEGIVRYTR